MRPYKSNIVLLYDERPRPRPGGRSARVVDAVLGAALEVFAERGYAGFSIDEVATRARVNKTTVYRRWPTKSDLVRAAMLQLKDDGRPEPDRGSLRDDLFDLVSATVVRLRTPRGRNIARAALLGATDPELAGLLADLRRARPMIPPRVIDRAITRGELPADTDAAFLGEALVAFVQRRLVWRAQTLSDADLRRIIDLVLVGATNGGGKRGARGRRA